MTKKDKVRRLKVRSDFVVENVRSTKLSSKQLEHDMLRTINDHGRPIGSWTLHFLLREQGYSVSAPTLGRRLRDLEIRGMLSPATKEGRSLTKAGKGLLKRTDDESVIRKSTGKLLLSLKRNRRKDLIDQLVVRRVIEGESAALAAQNASEDTVVVLQEIIEDQRRAIAHGDMGVDEDVRFHEVLAQASGNPVLSSFVHLLRLHPWFNHVINAIRAKVGGQRIVDHEQIVMAISRHDPVLAREAMERHINQLMNDVERYWGQVFNNPLTQAIEMDEEQLV